MLFDSEMTHDKPYLHIMVHGIRYTIASLLLRVFTLYLVFCTAAGVRFDGEVVSPLKSNEYQHAYKYIRS